MSIAVQAVGVILLVLYVYSACWVIWDGLSPSPEFPHRKSLIGPARAGTFFLGTGALAGWAADEIFGGNATITGIVGLAAATGLSYLLTELKRRGLVEMQWEAETQSRKLVLECRSLGQERLKERVEQLQEEIRNLRAMIPVEGDIGRPLSRAQWVLLWRNEAALASLAVQSPGG